MPDPVTHQLRASMREEFASYSFLAVAIVGLILLCSGLLTLAFGV
jgi:hypothetical protein